MKKNWKETLKLWLGALLVPFAVVAEAVGTGCKKLRTLPKKVMAVCIAAALLVAMVPVAVFAAETTYNVWVGGVQFTGTNLVIDGEDVTGITGSATFNPETKTLTLDNFSYTGEGTFCFPDDEDIYGVIASRIELTIKLRGDNCITCTGTTSGIHAGIATGEPLVICDDPDASGTGELTVSGEYGIVSAGRDFSARSSVVKVTADRTAIYGVDSARIETSTLIAEGGNSAFGNSYGEAINTHISNAKVFAGENESAAKAAGPVAIPDNNIYRTTAKYVKIVPACKVTVNYGVDGVDNKEITVTKGDTISLETPVIDGYIFMGWYTDADFTTAFDFDTPITATTTVYAKLADYEGDKKTLQDAIDALEADVAQLNVLIESGGAIAQINAKISAIESKVLELDALKNKYAEADTALKQELQQELQAADTAIISAITALTGRVDALEDEIDDLQTDVNGNAADIAENAAELAALNTSLTNLSNKLTNDYATKAELTSAINSAKDTINSAINALTVRVQDLEADLAAANSKIDTNTSEVGTLKSDVATLKTWKTEAQSAITALQTLTGTQSADIANLKLAVQSLEAELAAANARIDAAEDRIAALEGKVSALEIAKQNLDAAVAALNAAINNKADTATLNQKVTDLTAAIAAAEDAAKTYADGKDTALQTQLTAAIATAKGEAITAAENLVNTAKAELQTAINNKADIATLNAKVAELNAAIATAEATAKAYTDSAVTTLNAAIITAKDEAVDAAKDLVDAAKAQLQAAIDNKADTAAVNAAIANLQNAITALQNAKDNYIAADAALKAELEAAIAKAKQEAIDAAKGYIPYIGTNGNWWIGDTDTGVDANGIAGNKGDKGDTGADGVGIAKIEKTATDGNVDTYTVTLTNGKTYTFTVTNGKDGADGKDGTDGKDGENGKDGLTPFIGENGNWWIGDTDTGVKAVAEQTAQKGTDTITVVSIVVASVALLSNLALVVWIVTKKKKVLV